MKFYPADWRDALLRNCSLGARGLWIDLMTYMHESEPYGHLLIAGRPPAINTIALHLARPAAEVKRAMEELEANGVFSKTGDGIIFSRRMVRDFQKAERDKAFGRDGGNPALKGGVNPPYKTTQNGADKAQWPLVSSSLPSSATPLELKEVEEEKACGRDFGEFWAQYPNKIGKKAALASFHRARKTVDFATIMAALRAYINKSDDRPWCNPATWLNQGRWDDQPAQQQQGGVNGAGNDTMAAFDRAIAREKTGPGDGAGPLLDLTPTSSRTG